MKRSYLKFRCAEASKKRLKRLVGIVTAIVMTMSCLPMSEVADGSKLLYKSYLLMRQVLNASAVEEGQTAYNDLDYSYTTESAAEGSIIKISNIEQLIWYSHAYYNFAIGESGYADHQEDTIVFAFGQDAIYKISSLSETDPNYEPIGTANKPFKGKILFDGSSDSTFYLEAPLFGDICDNVIIAERDKVEGAYVPKRITIATATPAVYVPVFARHVSSDEDDTTIADWRLNYGWYTDDLGKVYTSMIGEIASGAAVNFDVTNNAIKSTTGGTVRANVVNTGSGDVGILCGKLNASAKLTATYSGSNTDFSVTAAQGNAGGFVGSMGAGSEFTLNITDNPMGTSRIKSDTGYAGGIVGENNGGTVTLNYTGSGDGYPIRQTITGLSGAGGIAGYYKPETGTSTFDASQFDIDNCKLTVTGENAYVGGLFGKVENDGSILTISGTSNTIVNSYHCDEYEDTVGVAANAYGGIIGYYSAANLTDSLEINTLKAEMSSQFSNSSYGGGIGQINGASYVKFDTFSVNSVAGVENATKFGGLTALTDKGYVYANDITVGCSDTEISGFAGGGLIGGLGDGVLAMTGIINLANAKPTVAANNGQLVGTRDNALIYAEDWTYTSNGNALDNVGSWGDAIVFGTTTIGETVFTSSLKKANVMTADASTPTTHVLTIPEVTANEISDENDYTRASLQFQIDDSKNDFLTFDGTSSFVVETGTDSKPTGVLLGNLTLTGNITLTNSGVRGITRDNGTSRVTYKGSVTGGDNTVTQDIKNVGGNPVYYHQYLGMFGITDSSTFTNTKFGGTIFVDAAVDNIYVGTAAGRVKKSISVTGCETESGLNITVNGAKITYAGRLIGDVLELDAGADTNPSLTVSGGTFDGMITGSNSSGDTCLGGVIGKITYSGESASNWTFSGTVTLKGTINKTGAATQKIGGLVAEISGGNYGVLNLTSVETDGLIVSGTASTAMGGLLGYGWYNTDVNIIDVSIADTTTTYSTVSKTGNGSTAGVVHTASGHWLITKLDLTNITMTAVNASSVGMIVNKGISGSGDSKSGIYLEIPATSDNVYYKLSFRSASLKSGGVFDEICAYSADSAANVMKNHQGIITISTTSLKMETTAEDSLSYKNQTEQGAVKNPNTRYYYNLDLIDNDNDISSSPEKQLMSWGLYHYACHNINSKYFVNSDLNKSSTYDMKGYSWYPVTLDEATTISGTFKFYNKEFDDCEAEKGKRTGITNANIWSPLQADQHYMMQNGLFYNATENLTIGNVTLQGNISAVNDNGTGVLVYGTAYGYADDTITHIVTINSTNGKIILDGIRVWNLSDHSSYAPLLINQASEYVTMNINDVSTTSSYTSGGATIDAATSLIGKAGNSETSKAINVSFTKIKLDAREIEQSGTGGITLSGFYPTTKSVFTNATLLESFQYATNSGSSGSYNFTYADDWAGSTPDHYVTYGLEIWDGSHDSNNKPTNSSSKHDQYIGEEHWYSKTASDTALRYVSYINGSPNDKISFAGFLPYVNTVNTKAEIEAGGTLHQLIVNHQPLDQINGCGTYNDPYIIESATDLQKISKWIADGFGENDPIIIPADGIYATWCTNPSSSNPDHKTYKKSGDYFYLNGDTTSTDKILVMDVRRYIAGAYYVISGNATTAQLTLDPTDDNAGKNFKGLGGKDAGLHFRGVIIGKNKVITNKTAYPLITYSDGSVVKDLTIKVDSSSLTNGRINCKGDSVVYESQTYQATQIRAYGAVFGEIIGGDNIIDNVQVNLSDAKIYLEKNNGGQTQLIPVGGYVGVIVNGGLVFRNMSGTIGGLTDNSIITSNLEVANTTMINSDNNAWMFVNPIIGRVINGYAVTESDAYRPREADVTMKNSTGNHSDVKNYSITDIKSAMKKDINNNFILSDSEKLDVKSATAIDIPNSQSFYLMSLMINCGLSIQPGVNKSDIPSGSELGYFKDYYTLHFGNYNEVGNSTSADYNTYAVNDINYASIATDDYVTKKVQYVPYLIKNYSKPYTATISDASPSTQTVYYAKTIGYKFKEDLKTAKSFTVKLTGTSDYIYDLSDGFRGIGNFIKNDDNLRLNVNTFTGNGLTIKQNTKYYYYDSDYDAYKPSNDENAGLGLFNCLNTNGNFSNFKLTGSVKCDAISRDGNSSDSSRKTAVSPGEHIEYRTEKTNANRHLSAAMLFATVKEAMHPTIDSVALQNIDVHGVRHTGGLIGNLIKSGTSAVKITNTKQYDSYGIKVHGAGSTAGLIGRNQEGIVQVNLKNCHFNINEIVCECTYRADDAANTSNTTKSDYNYGVAGFIGICRSKSTTNNKFENIIIGTSNISATIQCTDGGTLFTGGVIGVINRANVEVTDCSFYNISVESNYMSGGLVADCITASTPTVTNTHLYGNKTSSIVGSTYSGGFIGNTDERTDGGETFILRNSSIEGYIIQGTNAAGGVIGHRGAKNDDAILQIENFSIVNCTIKGTTSAGGIAGEMKHPIQGYNILSKNLKIDAIISNDSIINKGYIVGLNSNSKAIKLVAFTRQEILKNDETSSMVQTTVGNGGYGLSGYVIFSDYLGTQTNHSTITDDTLFLFNDAGKGPYVNINPKNTVGSSQYLTGDGVSAFATADRNSTETFAKICKDIRDNAEGSTAETKYAGYYQTAANYADTEAKYTRFTNKISSFAKEMQNYKPANGVDFPVLIVDDTNSDNTTALINEYISLLTNTSGYNFANNVTNVYDTYLSKCIYDSDGTTVSLSPPSREDNRATASADPCLVRAAGKFSMYATKTDTLEVNNTHKGQFTLLDVRFFDPSNTSEVVYHLYVPIYVRKLLEYDFDIRAESGTNYYKNTVSAMNENNVIENMGVPVTLEFAYTYKRTLAEWISAANNGDSLLANYDKSLVFSNTTKKLAKLDENGDPVIVNGEQVYITPDFIDKKEDISMVLIDPQNNSKAYYLNELNSTVFTSGENGRNVLNLNSSLGGFEPVKFNDLMEVTVSADSSGQKNLVLTTDESQATLKATDGKFYRYRDTSANEQGTHAVTNITLKDGSTELTEHYFLTIYTKYDEADATSQNPVVYHYTISSPQTFGSEPYPSRLTTAGEKKASHLLMGYIYNNTVDIKSIKVGGSTSNHELTDEENQMVTEVEAKIGFTQAGLDNVRTYLNQQNHPEIFESLLIKFDKRADNVSDVGIKGVGDVSINSYSIGTDNVLSKADSTTNSSHIELRNNTDLSDKMFRLEDTEGRVTITATATITFDNIAAQFYPEKPEENRTYVFAYSNIASDKSQTASSKVSAKDEEDPNRYYTSITEAATLTYDAVEIAGIGLTPQLGINPIDSDNNFDSIQTLGAYNIEHFLGSAQGAGYIRCDIQLKSIDDGYTNELIIADYINKNTFSILEDITPVTKVQEDSGTTWTFIYDKDDLELKGNIYQIPIEFTPYTGTNFESGNTRKYANYGLFLKVSMLVNADDSIPITKSDPAPDYVKWTNARITTKQVNP